MVQGDAVADSEGRGARGEGRGADFYDGAGGFVAEDARGWDGAVLDFFDVGGANAAGGDFDQEFVSAKARDGDGFDAEIVGSAVNGGAHGFWDFRHGDLLTQRRGGAKERKTTDKGHLTKANKGNKGAEGKTS
jgi:hypothetical protein